MKTIPFIRFALFALCAVTGFTPLQAADETDTAPGGGVNDSMESTSAPASVPARKAPVVSVPQVPSLLPNSNFELVLDDPDLPEGWENRQEGIISREKNEAGGHFVRLASTEKDQLVQLTSTLKLPPDVKAFDFTARFRTANVKFGKSFMCDARTMFKFLNADGKSVGKNPGDLIFSSHAKEWTLGTRRLLVPEGATQIQVNLTLNRPASGILDVDEVWLTPVSKEEAEALAMVPILAAKKKAEDEAEIPKILELPSKTLEIKVAGNKLVTADGTRVRLQGVNVCSLEWSAKGESILRSMKVALDDWKANAIRLPVVDSFWFGRGKPPKVESNDAEAYRTLVDQAIQMAAARGAYVILDLHRFKAPEETAVEFWKDAATRYKNNPAVLFDIFNEPHGISWEVWRNGGEIQVKQKDTDELRTFQSPGMQGLVDAVRSTGAKNIIIAGGIGYAYDLSGVLEGFALEEKGGNGIMYATHFYNWHGGWEKKFLPLVEKYPILVGEFGADVKKMSFIPAKNQEDPYTWAPDALAMIQKYELNWTAFSFHPGATPVLIKNWNYEPTPFWGAFVQEALAGKQFELKRLR